ncbi:MAG: Peptide deformylase [Devosia sp.]|nr:Peptide deformylase [Devosia sp.]
MQAAGEHLLAAAAAAQAFGLAGAHLGLVEPVMVVSVSDDLSQRDYRLFFNPQVLETSTAIQSGTEGSVSLPGVEVAISRPVWAVIGYDDAQGQPRTDRFEGFVARCCLHEIEQIGGVFFLSHLSRLKRDAVLRKFKKGLRAG